MEETNKDFIITSKNYGLAKCILNALQKIGYSKESVSIDNEFSSNRKAVIPQAYLEKIKKLDMKYEVNTDYSLEGIEKLVNLEEFNFNGASDRDILMEKFRGSVANNSIARQRYKDFQLQQDDLERLYKCPKLQKLSLKNQRKLTTINFLNFVNLKNLKFLDMSDCTSLREVEGLEWIEKYKEDDFLFNFDGCQKCSCKYLNFMQFVKGLKDYYTANPDSEIKHKFIFPTTMFNNILSRGTRNKDFVNKQDTDAFLDSNFNDQNIIVWSEFDDGGVKVIQDNRQVCYTRKCIKKIIDEMEIPEELKQYNGYVIAWLKFAYFYYYMSQNFLYDKYGVNCEDFFSASYKKFTQEAVASGNLTWIQSSDLNRTRNSYEVITKKIGVCVGFANLLACAGRYLGIEADTIGCRGDVTNNESETFTISNHAITRIKLGDRFLYCDPTWDLPQTICYEEKIEGYKKTKLKQIKPKDNISYFMKNKKELEKLNHYFTIEDNADIKKFDDNKIYANIMNETKKLYYKKHTKEKDLAKLKYTAKRIFDMSKFDKEQEMER